jgi:hypothetical protein
MFRIPQRASIRIAVGLLAAASAIFGLSRSTRSFLVGLCSSTIIAPQVGQSFTIACGPVFNQFPVSYTPKGYTDWPLIDGRNITKGGSWSKSQAEHDHGVEVEPGDVVEIYVHFHNGALDGESCEDADAVRAVVQALSDPALGEPSLIHQISADIRAANAPEVGSSSPGKGGDVRVLIRGGTPQSLSLVPGSVRQVLESETEKAAAPTHLLETVFDGGVDLGTVMNGPKYAGFVVFRLEVSKTK